MLEKKLKGLVSIRIEALYDQFINESDADILLQEIKSKRLEESDMGKITKLMGDNRDCFKSNSADEAIDAVRQIFLIQSCSHRLVKQYGDGLEEAKLLEITNKILGEVIDELAPSKKEEDIIQSKIKLGLISLISAKEESLEKRKDKKTDSPEKTGQLSNTEITPSHSDDEIDISNLTEQQKQYNLKREMELQRLTRENLQEKEFSSRKNIETEESNQRVNLALQKPSLTVIKPNSESDKSRSGSDNSRS